MENRTTTATSEEFDKLLEALSKEIRYSSYYFTLYKNLLDSANEYAKEFAQSQTFWFLTFNSLINSTLLHLCKVYDQEKSSLNLGKLLQRIRENSSLFSKENFEKRLSGNDFVNSLSSIDRIPNIEEIDTDLKLVTNENPLVKKLIIWRHNVIVHCGENISLGKNKILADNPISEEEINTLLDNSLKIFNKYSGLFRASYEFPKMLGHDDYKSVLKYLKIGLEQFALSKGLK
jgi:hypothetical protein